MNDKKGIIRKSDDQEDWVKEELRQREEEDDLVEIVSLDVEESQGEPPADLDAETALNLLQDAREEAYEEEISHYTTDKEIQEALEERQDLNAGKEEMLENLVKHHATSPKLSGGDVDAAWDDAGVGEETVGGMAPTPDQDRVDELGEAVGITYEDDEPLQTGEKLAERDRERWELDPDSAEAEEET